MRNCEELAKFFCWFIDDLIEKEWTNELLDHKKSMDFISFRNGFYKALKVLDLIEDPENIPVMYFCNLKQKNHKPTNTEQV